jgi:hypothetical protein
MTLHFTVKVQERDQQFVIPTYVKSAFGWEDKSQVGLLIFDEGGDCLFCGPKNIMSGESIYGSDIRAFAKTGERLHVYAFRWPSSS